MKCKEDGDKAKCDYTENAEANRSTSLRKTENGWWI